MSTAGGGAAQVIVDILANATGLGQTLSQAEKQVQESANRMGKTMDTATGQGAPGQSRLANMFRGRGALIGSLVTQFAGELATDFKGEFDRRSDLAGSVVNGIESGIKMIPGVAPQLGAIGGDLLKPVGTRIGEEIGRSIAEAAGFELEQQFEEGTAYGLGDYLSDFLNNRTQRQMGRGIRTYANQNLILDRQRELAALSAEQEIMRQTDVRGQMIQSRMHMGMAEFQTGMGTFRAAFGTPQEASARVYDAAMKQVVALERIESIVKEIGQHARNAMRN